VLRAAYEDLLPTDILWREKKQFDEGSGMTELLPLALEPRWTPEKRPYADVSKPAIGAMPETG
jgi:asparagine synthase (glutamine-hydrolysing)